MNQNKAHKKERAIRQCRSRLKLTQAEAAHLLGITPAYYSMMERGQRNMPTDMLLTLFEWKESCADTNKPVQDPFSIRQQQQCNAYLHRQKRDLSYRIKLLTHEHKRFRSRHLHLFQKRESVCLLLQNANQPERTKAYLQFLEKDCAQQLRQYAPEQLIRLEEKLVALRARLRWVEEKLGIGFV